VAVVGAGMGVGRWWRQLKQQYGVSKVVAPATVVVVVAVEAVAAMAPAGGGGGGVGGRGAG
jgi:hypothetical protein